MAFLFDLLRIVGGRVGSGGVVVVNGNTGKVVGRFRFEFGYIIRVGHGEAEDEW